MSNTPELPDSRAAERYLGLRVAGLFTIEALVGTGASAHVFRASQAGIDRPVAIEIAQRQTMGAFQRVVDPHRLVVGRREPPDPGPVAFDQAKTQRMLETLLTERGGAKALEEFQTAFEKRTGKKAELALLSEDLPEAGTVSFTRQQSPLGLGHAVWCARELVGHEPFALLLPDVLVQHTRGCLAQMIDAAKELNGNANIIAVEEVPKERVHMYGVVGVGAPKGKAFAITKMVEKPKASEAPSNLTITGRYILQPQIFELLEKQAAGAGGEIQLTDAMLALSRSQPFYGLKFEGRSFDCGSKIGFLAANVAYGLERADIAPELRSEMRRLLDGM